MASARLSGWSETNWPGSPSRILQVSKPSFMASSRPAAAKASISIRDSARARSWVRGPRMLAAVARTLLGALPASREAWAAASAGCPCRFSPAPMATLIKRWSLMPPGSCSSARLTLLSSGNCAASSIDTPCKLVSCVLASICEAPDVSFMDWRGSTAPICCFSAAICWP